MAAFSLSFAGKKTTISSLKGVPEDRSDIALSEQKFQDYGSLIA
jgi:hypothetical protein